MEAENKYFRATSASDSQSVLRKKSSQSELENKLRMNIEQYDNVHNDFRPN